MKVKWPGGASFYPIGRGQYDDDEGDLCGDVVIGNVFDNPELLGGKES